MKPIHYRPLQPSELNRLGEIDRTERVETIYYQQGANLKESAETFDIPPWSPTGDEFHTVPFQIGFCEEHLARGGQLFGAFDGERLVGIGLVTPHLRPGIAQLAYLHVSHGYRGRGVGQRLVEEMERVALAVTMPSDASSPVPANDRFSENRVGLDHVSFSVGSHAELEAAAAYLDEQGVTRGEIRDLGAGHLRHGRPRPGQHPARTDRALLITVSPKEV